jgi:hypothetical protein
MAWTTPATASAGSTALTAAFWNTQVRDNMVELAGPFGTFTSWTPQVDQGVNLNIAKTVGTGKYVKIGKLVIAWAGLSMTAAGAAGNITVSLPVTAAAGNAHAVGNGYFFDASAPLHYHWTAVRLTTTTLNFISDASTNNYFGSTPGITIANGDAMFMFIIYEAAS